MMLIIRSLKIDTQTDSESILGCVLDPLYVHGGVFRHNLGLVTIQSNFLYQFFLCFVDCAYLYNLVNKANLVHNLFLVYLSISTCFGRLWVHHQEKQLCFLLHLLLVILCGCPSGMQGVTHSTLQTRQSPTQNKKYQVSQKHRCFSSWWAHSRPKHVEMDKYTKNKLYIKMVLFTRFVCQFAFRVLPVWNTYFPLHCESVHNVQHTVGTTRFHMKMTNTFNINCIQKFSSYVLYLNQSQRVDAYFENHKKHIKVCLGQKRLFLIFNTYFTHYMTGVESFDKSRYFLLRI